jgi:hypothetical protein
VASLQLAKGRKVGLLAHYLACTDPGRGVLRVDKGCPAAGTRRTAGWLGRRMRAIIAAGKLVPDFVATSLLADYVSNNFRVEPLDF